MITKIKLSKVASYKAETVLETDRKVNLIYGLNGAGKSTLSNFLYNRNNPNFSSCSIEGYSGEEILTYNQNYISDFFYESDSLKGIFTLSKENKQAEQKIKQAESEVAKHRETIKQLEVKQSDNQKNFANLKQKAENKFWEIKTRFTGGDRVLEYCLENLMGRKESLTNHILSIAKPEEQPKTTVELIKQEVESLERDSGNKIATVSKINFPSSSIESNTIFQKIIIGNEDSPISQLIATLGNSDWVYQGIKYLPENIPDANAQCPFCQEKTVTSDLISEITNYFDKSYKSDLDNLQKAYNDYKREIESTSLPGEIDSHPFLSEAKSEIELLFTNFKQIVNANLKLIEEKIKTPSQIIELNSSSEAKNTFNEAIETVNRKISEHNLKLDNKKTTLNNLKTTFWSLMRWEYDQTITSYNDMKSEFEKRKKEIDEEKQEALTTIEQQKKVISEQQKKTVNIEEAIQNINNGLRELGIDSFHIAKHTENLYKIVRDEEDKHTFMSLSEGEKMIISFLYFREQCKGKKEPGETTNPKIVIIDDPISSLSHIYVFNVALLIKNDFFNSPLYDQIFILTHSLYFFYELTDTNHDRRKQNQILYRLIKDDSGSKFFQMKYEEIQNDYHAYWSIVKNPSHPPALLANSMRNIIEYFFGFIEKKDFSNIQQMPSLKEPRFQAFFRYINRESHSLGQNIFDFKEFNYDDFKDALKNLFIATGYEEHYKKMIQ